MSNFYADPETIRQYEEFMKSTPEGIAATMAAEEAEKKRIQAEEAFRQKQMAERRADPLRSDRGGSRRRSRKSRKSRRK
jgi:hypothetical protein